MRADTPTPLNPNTGTVDGPGTGGRGPEHLDPLRDDRWAAPPTDGLNALFVDRRWLRTLAAVYGFAFTAAIASDSHGSLRSVLPYAVIDDARGCRVSSLPSIPRACAQRSFSPSEACRS